MSFPHAYGRGRTPDLTREDADPLWIRSLQSQFPMLTSLVVSLRPWISVGQVLNNSLLERSSTETVDEKSIDCERTGLRAGYASLCTVGSSWWTI